MKSLYTLFFLKQLRSVKKVPRTEKFMFLTQQVLSRNKPPSHSLSATTAKTILLGEMGTPPIKTAFNTSWVKSFHKENKREPSPAHSQHSIKWPSLPQPASIPPCTRLSFLHITHAHMPMVLHPLWEEPGSGLWPTADSVHFRQRGHRQAPHPGPLHFSPARALCLSGPNDVIVRL